jgi:acyl-coenzyme A thioesterase PaaI-like protein
MTEGNQAELFAERQRGTLPGELGIQWDEVTNGLARRRFVVAGSHMAPNGFLHAASVIALVDSACGYGCMTSLPDGATAARPRSGTPRPSTRRRARPWRSSGAPRWSCIPAEPVLARQGSDE